MYIYDIMKNVYVINVDEQAERYSSFVKEMDYANISKYTRIPATTPNIHQGLDYNTAIKHSHIRCMEKGLSSGEEYVTICEDDMYFDRRYISNTAVLEDIKRFIDREQWFIFYLGICCKLRYPPEKTDYDHVRRMSNAKGTYTYLFHRRGLSYFLDNYKKRKYEYRIVRGKEGTTPLDVTFLNLMHSTGKCFASSPRLTIPDFTSARFDPKKIDIYMSSARDVSINERF